MEEKKLTDKELVKNIEYCMTHDDCSEDCPMGKVQACMLIMLEQSLDLIHRLQDESAKQKAEIERIHKAIDEEFVSLKAVRAAENSPKAMKMLVESIGCVQKDAAKEIFDWLKSKVIMTEIPHGSEPSEEDVEAVMWWQIEEHFKKRYGVEVE